jgi:predicted dienelactone hydrolase
VVSPVLRRLALAFGLATAAAAASADVGMLQLAPRADDSPLVVFYPSSDTAAPLVRGPFRLNVAWQGKPVRGNGRLVVMSHGTGGSADTMADLASRLVASGFVVAVPEHRADNWHDSSDRGPASWKRRPVEISQAIDTLAAEPRFAPLLQLDRVGMWGMSAGGHTALTLAGGRWSPAALARHCEAHLAEDFATCVGLATELNGNWLDAPKKAIARFIIKQRLDDTAWYTHQDRRIAAIVAEVPFAVDFDPASLAQPVVPLALIRAGHDNWLAPAFHIGAVLKACAKCQLLVDLPTAGHASLLSPVIPGLSGPALRLLSDPPGFDRALVAPAHERIAAYLRQHLLP